MSFKRFLNSHFVFGNKNHISFLQGSSFRFAVIIFLRNELVQCPEVFLGGIAFIGSEVIGDFSYRESF